MNDALKKRIELTTRLYEALKHLPLERIVYIISSNLSLDELEKLVKFQERDDGVQPIND